MTLPDLSGSTIAAYFPVDVEVARANSSLDDCALAPDGYGDGLVGCAHLDLLEWLMELSRE